MGAFEEGKEGLQAEEKVRKQPISVPIGCQEGEIGNGGHHEGLEKGLGPAEVACLSDAELDEAGKPMLCHLAQGAIGQKRWAVLKSAGRPKKGFLGMELDAAAAAAADAG